MALLDWGPEGQSGRQAVQLMHFQAAGFDIPPFYCCIFFHFPLAGKNFR